MARRRVLKIVRSKGTQNCNGCRITGPINRGHHIVVWRQSRRILGNKEWEWLRRELMSLKQTAGTKISETSVQGRINLKKFIILGFTDATAESFIRSQQLLGHSRNIRHFMEPGDSSPFSQESATGSHSGPQESSFSESVLVSSHLCLRLRCGLFRLRFPT
jgi:hypothetical protein